MAPPEDHRPQRASSAVRLDTYQNRGDYDTVYVSYSGVL